MSSCLFRNVFKVDDIALNYRDPEGDLIRILDDEDIQLMIEESRGQRAKVKRPVNQFPWELHVTLASDLSVYNVEAWEGENRGRWWKYLVLFYQNNELKPGACCCWWCVVCSNYCPITSLLFHLTADTFHFLINLFNHIFFHSRTSVSFLLGFVGICSCKRWSTQPGAAVLAWLARGGKKTWSCSESHTCKDVRDLWSLVNVKHDKKSRGELEDVELNLTDKYIWVYAHSFTIQGLTTTEAS